MSFVGKYYLVDSGYANQDCFLAPYRGNTYHLQEYRERRGGITSSRELFNYTHSSQGYVWLGGWRVGRRESIGRMESVKDGDDYNNPSSCLVGRRDR